MSIRSEFLDVNVRQIHPGDTVYAKVVNGPGRLPKGS